MRVIDLLNKIANGEIEENIKYKFSDYDYCTIKEFFNRYVVDKWNLNLEIIEEEKKIPEKEDELIGYNIQEFNDLKEFVEITTNDVFGKINKIINNQNKIIDYLKSKGD